MTMASHIHGPNYVRPDDRGRCMETSITFGQLLQCDSPNFAGSRRCLLHHLVAEFAMTETEAAEALAYYYAMKAAQ